MRVLWFMDIELCKLNSYNNKKCMILQWKIGKTQFGLKNNIKKCNKSNRGNDHGNCLELWYMK